MHQPKQQKPNKVELVIFDCDGVIVDSEIISADMLIEQLRDFRVEIDHAFVARNFLGRSYPVVFNHIRDVFGVELPKDFEADYRANLLRAFEKSLVAIPHVQVVAQRLNVPFCVATSSSPERVERTLQIANLDETFGQNVFTSAEVIHGKPAPDLPLHAAKKMGANPANCLIIEDSFNGMRAGQNANMQVAWFTGGSHIPSNNLTLPEDVKPDWQFDHFKDFFDIRPELSMLNSAKPSTD